MEVVENPSYSRDYLDPDKRSIANAVQICFRDGTTSQRIEIEYPLGHPRRRDEGIPLLKQKFRANLAGRLSERQCQAIVELFVKTPHAWSRWPADRFVELFVVSG